MGQKLSLTQLQKTIEDDLKEELEIRYLFSLSTTIKQEATQAVCKIPISVLPSFYEFDPSENHINVVVKVISKK